MVGDVEVAEPVALLLELQATLAEVEIVQGVDPEADLDEGDEKRERPDPPPRHGRKPDADGAAERQEDQDCRQPAHVLSGPR